MSLTTRIEDRGEPISSMEPLLISRELNHHAELMDLAVELAARSSGLRKSLSPGIYAELAKLVRTMNCYYSNLIEDHPTHPIDIERSLKGDYSQNKRKRNLQLEAHAHVACQEWIDEGGMTGRVYTAKCLMELHRRFYEMLPDDLLWVENEATKERVKIVPGEMRIRDIRVGSHVPVSPGALLRFMERFESVYSGLGKSDSILAAAGAHHRFAWIHPFIDGNGRVARLMSHASMLETLDTGGVWSVARGLARSKTDYKALLAEADQLRRNDLDGRGNLSQEALVKFTKYFLEVCLDQVNFMEGLVQPDKLRTRILVWAEEEIRMKALPEKAGRVLEAILYRGELSRKEVAKITEVDERQARRVVTDLKEAGVLFSEGPRTPLRLAFPATLANRWMPNLYPEKTD